jgi:hypothetical protein
MTNAYRIKRQTAWFKSQLLLSSELLATFPLWDLTFRHLLKWGYYYFPPQKAVRNQWKSTCLTYERLWVKSPIPKIKNTRKIKFVCKEFKRVFAKG